MNSLFSEISSIPTETLHDDTSISSVSFCGKILKLWGLTSPFHFVGILSSCILNCRWIGLRVCIQSCIISHQTHSTWLGKRNLIVCSDLRGFVCGFGGQGLELVFSELPALIVHECSGPEALSFKERRWANPVNLGKGLGHLSCLMSNCCLVLEPNSSLFEKSFSAACSSVSSWWNHQDTIWDFNYFHGREKLPNPSVWRAVVKADTELVVPAPSCLPVLRAAGDAGKLSQAVNWWQTETVGTAVNKQAWRDPTCCTLESPCDAPVTRCHGLSCLCG